MPDASAKSLSPEALELKRRGRRRLLGALVIALLLVVFVPMILDSEPRKAGKEIALTIPAKEGQPPLPAPGVIPLKPEPKPAEPAPAVPKSEEASATPEAKLAAKPETAAPAPAQTPASPPSPAAAKPEPKPAEVKPAEVKAVEAKPEPKAAPKQETKVEPKTDAKKLEGFAVQLGAFSETDKVKQLVTKLKAAKIPVFTEQIKGDSGTLTRVRAGPYKTRELADKGLTQVKKAGADGKVVPLP
jgi:DedD protein